MGKWRLKNCPRCGGDTFLDTDIYGWYQQCLQCSYRYDLKQVNTGNKKVPADSRK